MFGVYANFIYATFIYSNFTKWPEQIASSRFG